MAFRVRSPAPVFSGLELKPGGWRRSARLPPGKRHGESCKKDLDHRAWPLILPPSKPVVKLAPLRGSARMARPSGHGPATFQFVRGFLAALSRGAQPAGHAS